MFENERVKIAVLLRYLSIYLLILFCSAWSSQEYKNDSIPELIPHPSPTVELTPTLQWHKLLIPVNKYFIQIDTADDFTFPLINVSSADTFYTSDIDLPLCEIFWRVSMDLTKWSELSSFIIEDGRIPVLIPYDDSTYETKPTLRWYTPPVAVSSYTIQVSNKSDFDTLLINTNSSDTFYTCLASLPIGMIYWKVKGDDSDFSDVSSFFIIDGRIPVLIPYENPTFERKPTLRWYKPPVQVTTYLIQISIDSIFDSLLVNALFSDTFFVCQEEFPLGMIYWRVNGDDSEFSNVNSFEVKDNRVPLLIPYMPKITHETQPALYWKKITGANTYTIEIDNNIDFSSAFSIPLSDTAFTPIDPLSIGEIYWRVKSDLVDTWSGVDHFTIIPDSIPLLVRFKGKKITNKKPTFSWRPVNGADSYIFKLADNIIFNNAITNPLEDTSYTIGANLDYGKYYWKVSCSKNLDLYSPVDSLIIDSITSIYTQNTIIPKQGIYFKQSGNSMQIILNRFPVNDISADVYGLNGRIVTKLKAEGNKSNLFIWNYKDNHGNAVPSGIYLIALKTRMKLYAYKVILSR